MTIFFSYSWDLNLESITSSLQSLATGDYLYIYPYFEFFFLTSMGYI